MTRRKVNTVCANPRCREELEYPALLCPSCRLAHWFGLGAGAVVAGGAAFVWKLLSPYLWPVLVHLAGY